MPKANATTKRMVTPAEMTEVEKESLHLLESVEKLENDLVEYYPKMLNENEDENATNNAESYKRASKNIIKSSKLMRKISDEFCSRWNDIKKRKKCGKIQWKTPSNTEIDIAESNGDYFAKGINVYKILMICFVGSFFGVVVEVLWCLINEGYVESRSGLVWGPFNLLYGVGAVALSVALYRFRNRGAWLSFLGGFAVGSVVEYLCSLGQELVFGSRSWDYSHMPFHINGRICLLYSVFWGFLGVFWTKTLYPLMAKAMLKLPRRIGKLAVWGLTAFFVLNSLVTVMAVGRWVARRGGEEAANVWESVMDERFPDERMERIFANMSFSEEAIAEADGDAEA